MVSLKSERTGVKPTKEYNWSFHRVNSNNERIFRHDTNENIDYVIAFLDKKKIRYDIRDGATMLWIYYRDQQYSYYYTTGRWAPFSKKTKYPRKHYYSKGIEDFYTRFLTAKTDPNTFKCMSETVEDVTKVLDYANVEYTVDDNVATLISKIIPRADGKGNRKRYSYKYIIGTGKWTNINSDGTCGKKYYQTSSIESFLTKYFIDDVEVK